MLLVRAVPPFTHIHFGQRGIHDPVKVPMNTGDIINWRKLAALSAVTTALDEGVTPDAHDITITAVNGTVAEYKQ